MFFVTDVYLRDISNTSFVILRLTESRLSVCSSHCYLHFIYVFIYFAVFDLCNYNVSDYNFSHRIDHFSFGDPVTGVVYPLDGTLYVTDSSKCRGVFIRENSLESQKKLQANCSGANPTLTEKCSQVQ